MRALVILWVMLLGLAGCVVPAGGPASAPLVETTLPPPAEAPPADLAPTPTPAPEPPAPVPVVQAPPEPPLLAQQRAACQRSGGQMMPRGGGLYSCIQPTRDAGRSCRAGSDCQGLCLARSGTCAPYQPLFGCHEVLTAPGRRETLCTE